MMEKIPRPVALNEGHRAGSGISWQDFRVPFITVEPRTLAHALRHGATLAVGLHDHRLRLAHFQSFLRNRFPQHDVHQRDQLLGLATITAHWFSFCRRRDRLNVAYSLSTFAYLIENCFSLARGTVTEDAILAGIADCRLSVQWVARVRDNYPGEFGWATNVSNKACSPNDPSRLVPLGDLGKWGAVPPILVEWGTQ
jgi:hypothetical protein